MSKVLVKALAVIEEKKERNLKGGNLNLTFTKGIFRMVHYGTTILEFKPTEATLDKQFTKWHIQSPTDARYIKCALNHFWGENSHMFDIGYGSVFGSRFRYRDSEGEWQEVCGKC